MSSEQSEAFVSIARSWLGTPYHHQGATKGSGCDCLGLIRGVYEEYIGHELPKPPAYTRTWGESDGQELMLQAASQHLNIRDKASWFPLQIADILIFRLRRGSVAKHAAIYLGDNRIIHSLEGIGVCEVNLIPLWEKKIAGVFSI